MPLKIVAYILTKAGNRAQNKARVLLLSLLPAFVSAQLSQGENGHFDRSGEILF